MNCLFLCACSVTKPAVNFSDLESQLQAVKTLPEKEQSEKISELMNINPLYSHRIIKYLKNEKAVNTSIIETVANSKKISIYKLLAYQGIDSVNITPLYHSASISIYSPNSVQPYFAQYKAKKNVDWISLPLELDPVSDAYTTSILGLEEDTLYDVKLSLDENFSQVDFYHFKTKGEPNFSSHNTYHLADIYNGGVLDLVKLGLNGTENNWVKIVGDDKTIISTNELNKSAINIGNKSYIYFENITISGGGVNAVSSDEAHHIRFNGCNISGWGRKGNIIKKGKFYANLQDTKPINFDSAFSLTKTGVVTIENCQVHSPRSQANTWKTGHPHGANAVLIDANHPNVNYKGQIVIRNNRFYGTDSHRFNDVIESRNNGGSYGGFVRDSAIYNNYLAYANDDIIEIDGSQFNVLVYDNEIEQGFCGISAIPNRQGPSFIFNNYIHNLGDENGDSWAAVKLGGLLSRPAGKVNIFKNIINTKSNGIASANYYGDRTFWADVWSNSITILNRHNYAILEKSPFSSNSYLNNVIIHPDGDGSLINVDDVMLFRQQNYFFKPSY